MTDMLNIIFDDFGIWLRRHYFIWTLRLWNTYE